LSSLTETQVLYFLAEFILLVLVARVLAELMQRWGQATVIGELLAGLILGPSVLGRISPGVHQFLFPPDRTIDHLLEASAWIGVIMLLLCTGLETDLDTLRGMRRPAALVSSLGIVIPFVSGFVLAWYLPASYLVAADKRLIFALFFAVALSISAVPVIAKILMDLDLMRRELGLLILAAGILDDTVGWLLLSVVAGLASSGKIDIRTLSVMVVSATAFLVFAYSIGFRIVSVLLRWIDDYADVEYASVTLMVGVAFVSAVITQAIGIHALFGAFVAGVMLGRSARTRDRDRDQIEAVTMGMLAPVFFAYSGLKADVFAIKTIEIPAIIVAIACASKFFGCGVAAFWSGLSRRESFAVAAGMNARGGMGIVVALMGLSLGVLTQEMYAIILIVAILTSLVAPPLLNWSLGGLPERASDIERIEREKVLEKLPFTKEGAKLLVLDAGGPHAEMATHLAASLGDHEESSITIFRASAAPLSKEAESNLQDRLNRLQEIAESYGARNVRQRSITGDSIREMILEESRRGYDAIFAGMSHFHRNDRVGGEILRELLSEASAPVIVARSHEELRPFRHLLAPVTGSSYSLNAAALGMLYGQSMHTSVTAIHVTEDTRLARRFFKQPETPNPGREVSAEVDRLATQLDLKVETKLAASSTRAEKAILNAVDEEGIDLLLMGVLYRRADQRAYFGPKVEYILENAQCAVALLVSPSIIERSKT
jgi:Kef-type K+ transport system membrane component KefB/nucleotide-binding universal stress UspA family protein